MAGEDRAIRIFLTSVFLLLGLGVVMVYSSTAIVAEMSPKYGDPYFFIKRHIVRVAVSVIAMVLVSFVPYRWYYRFRWWIFGIGVAGLVAVLIPGVGWGPKGVTRWIRLPGLVIQPSEVAKFCLLVLVAGELSRPTLDLSSFLKGPVGVFLATGLCAVLIMKEPDMGTAAFTVAVMGLVMVVGGVRWRHLVPIGVTGACGAVSVFFLKHDYVMTRIQNFLHPEMDLHGAGHQVHQGLIALGTGGLTGAGLGRGHQKMFYLPEQYNDFIFPVVGEELGLLGTLGTLVLFIAFFASGIYIVRRTRDKFAFLLSYGILLLIMCQALMNMAVVTRLMPTKGISLPFVSYGGSSMILVLTGVGVLLNIAGTRRRETDAEEPQVPEPGLTLIPAGVGEAESLAVPGFPLDSESDDLTAQG